LEIFATKLDLAAVALAILVEHRRE